MKILQMGNIAKIVRIHCVGAEPPAPMVAVRIPPLTADGFLGTLNQKPPAVGHIHWQGYVINRQDRWLSSGSRVRQSAFFPTMIDTNRMEIL